MTTTLASHLAVIGHGRKRALGGALMTTTPALQVAVLGHGRERAPAEVPA